MYAWVYTVFCYFLMCSMLYINDKYVFKSASREYKPMIVVLLKSTSTNQIIGQIIYNMVTGSRRPIISLPSFPPGLPSYLRDYYAWPESSQSLEQLKARELVKSSRGVTCEGDRPFWLDTFLRTLASMVGHRTNIFQSQWRKLLSFLRWSKVWPFPLHCSHLKGNYAKELDMPVNKTSPCPGQWLSTLWYCTKWYKKLTWTKKLTKGFHGSMFSIENIHTEWYERLQCVTHWTSSVHLHVSTCEFREEEEEEQNYVLRVEGRGGPHHIRHS